VNTLHSVQHDCLSLKWSVHLLHLCKACISPNSIMLTFTKTSARGKSPTQITKVADTNHLDMSRRMRQSPWQVCDKPIYVALMEFSPLRYTGKVGNKVRSICRGHKSWKSATWFVSRTFMICVHDKSTTLLGTCPGLCRKVGVMEFGLYSTFLWPQGTMLQYFMTSNLTMTHAAMMLNSHPVFYNNIQPVYPMLYSCN